MGVPKFFRYISERYPCLNELVKENQVPDFDNLYLDVAAIIHFCSHPEDDGPSYQITEEKKLETIFHYISFLFQIIKPKKLFFISMDGVPPRAKLNQHRMGSFYSAKEKQDKGLDNSPSTEMCFDTNCISPGTVFMERFQKQLRFFVKKKITTDPLWAGCKVILSGHETPGEGEHKIMDYIRWARSQEGYDPNTRHCLYGLDADLIMLAMCTHDPHFALLREEVKFGKNVQRKTTPEEINFFLLHLSLMREYLEQEFIGLKDVLPFEYDLEKIVDDWVLMGFLVGNDFIPNLPNMHIQNDALPVLYKTYMKVLPMLDGYINEAGDLHLGRFEVFMQELANLDKEAFQDTFADLQFFENKTGRRPNGNSRKEYKPNNDDTFNVNIEEIKSGGAKSDLQALIDATEQMMTEEDEDFEEEEDDDIYTDDKNEEDTFNMEFVLHKRDYYMNKLDYAKVTKEVLMSQAECYVRAIQWNLHYYYRGCVSWSWFYPHHYAPYMSDIQGFKDMKLEYDLGTPFKPFEQLLAVLPAASMELLPAPFHALMIGEESPIIQYYPINFETDLNGKKNDWEAVVLIPFIDENNLLSAMEPCYAQLSAEERQRNTHGPMLMYTHTKEMLGEVLAPGYFAPLSESHALEKEIWREELYVSEQNLKRGRLPNALGHLFFPGFPTMRHLKYQSRIEKSRVRVFDQLSRNDNMIMMLQRQESEPTLEQAAQELLGRVVWVGWPHLTQAKVISVSNEQLRYHHTPDNNCADSAVNLSTKQNVTEERNLGNLVDQWRLQRKTILEHTMGRMGIDVGDVNIIVHAVNLRGHKYVMEKNASFVVEPEWCAVPCGYALQAVVRDLAAHTIPALTRYSTVEDAFPPDQLVFVMTGAYYGCQAKVISSSAAARTGRIKVLVSEVSEPRTTPSVSSGPTTSYMMAHHVASRCGLSPQLVSRITGTTFLIHGDKGKSNGFEGSSKSSIGLNLKFNKKNLEVVGYTRRCETNNTWLYSARCLELICSYINQFPDMFNRMSTSQNMDNFYESDLWPDQVGAGKPEEVVAWLKQQAHTSAGKRECGSEVLEGGELAALAVSVDTQLPHLDNDKRLSLQVKIHLLYKPDLHKGNLPPDPDADFQLYDRVVNVNNNIEVPLGAKGTISAIYRQPTLNSVRLSDKLNVETSYQVLFDTAFPGGLTEDGVEGTRFYRLNASSMLNISYGRKLREDRGNSSENQYQYQNQPYQPTQNQRDQQDQKNQYQRDQPYQRNQYQRDQPYQKSQYQQEQQSNWRSNVLRTDDGHNSAFATYTSPKKERKSFNQNQGRPGQNQQPKSSNIVQPDGQDKTNIGQSNNADVTPVSDSTASTSDQSKSKDIETGTDLLKALLKINPPSAPAEVSLRPAKVPSSNWRRDSEEHQRTLTHPPTLTPSTLPQHPPDFPHLLSSLPQPPRVDQTYYQPRFPAYQVMQQPGLLGPGPGPGPNVPYPVQPVHPSIPNARPNNKTRNDRVNDRGFPIHLPQVGAREKEGATRNFNQALRGISQVMPPARSQPSSEPSTQSNRAAHVSGAPNQFVPHQVLKSQRKNKNDRDDNEASSTTAGTATTLPEQSGSSVAQVKQEPPKDRRRAPRNRIAANLPFRDMD